MQLSVLKYAVVALATHCSGVVSQLTPANVVDNIKTLTMKSQALQAPAKEITIVSGPLIIVGQGPFPKLIAGFTEIVTIATTAIPAMQAMPPVPAGQQSDAIFDAFREFVRVHQVLLNILIGKAGLFSVVPFIGAPVAAVLRQIEAVVDTVAFILINNVQSRANDLKLEADSLGGTIDISISKYQGIAGEVV
ncbi:hypothetical protein LX32DRAFT_681291 [Colletotrichum zoysiae]|uniref:UVI-1 protein n=1 Tax=Colletotrichum zoysiae TaxID=1216348 RepID=A0AAD9HNS6_9PEZI|nr:hypothetical protein LX32DRAFT_681291 [Colletotrichum zoysiae]